MVMMLFWNWFEKMMLLYDLFEYWMVWLILFKILSVLFFYVFLGSIWWVFDGGKNIVVRRDLMVGEESGKLNRDLLV